MFKYDFFQNLVTHKIVKIIEKSKNLLTQSRRRNKWRTQSLCEATQSQS